MDAAVLHPSQRAAAVAFAKIGFDALSIALHPVRAAVRTTRRPGPSEPNPEGCRSPGAGVRAGALARACRPFAALPATLHAPCLLRRARRPDGTPAPTNSRATGPPSLQCPPRRRPWSPSPCLPRSMPSRPAAALRPGNARGVDGDPGPSRRARIAHAVGGRGRAASVLRAARARFDSHPVRTSRVHGGSSPLDGARFPG